MKQAFQIKYEGLEFFIDEDARIVFFEFLENSEQEFQKSPEQAKQWESFKKALKKRAICFINLGFESRDYNES